MSISSPRAAFAYLMAIFALTLLVSANLAAPGCAGPARAQPCDFILIAKRAAERLNPYSPYRALEVVDQGSTVYVHQPAPPWILTHDPGVQIDKASCRVCGVDVYSTISSWPEPGREPIILDRRPPERMPDADMDGWAVG